MRDERLLSGTGRILRNGGCKAFKQAQRCLWEWWLCKDRDDHLDLLYLHSYMRGEPGCLIKRASRSTVVEVKYNEKKEAGRWLAVWFLCIFPGINFKVVVCAKLCVVRASSSKLFPLRQNWKTLK